MRRHGASAPIADEAAAGSVASPSAAGSAAPLALSSPSALAALSTAEERLKAAEVALQTLNNKETAAKTSLKLYEKALEAAPLSRIPGRSPSILFSKLSAGARIPPHHGLINTRLICHLPLLVPGPAWLRVGNRTHQWKEGELVVFDDSIEHEAKNEASETRVVLLFDIWRPELTPQERTEVTKLLGAIADFSGQPVVSGN